MMYAYAIKVTPAKHRDYFQYSFLNFYFFELL